MSRVFPQQTVNRRSLLAGASGAAALSVLSTRIGRAAQTPESASPSANTRVISAANGEVEISGTPERVVVLEYELAENAYILDLPVVGLAERDSVNEWVNLPEPYGDDVADVGARDELDIEAILVLDPDLILAASPRQDAVIDNLEAVAPTVQLATYSPAFTPEEGLTPIEHAQSILRQVALATGTTDLAETSIAEFDSLLERGRTAVEAVGLTGRPFLYAGGFDDANINLFNDRARIGYTVSQLGLTNLAGENEENSGLHFQAVSLESLGSFPAETLFFIANAPSIAEQANTLYESPLWTATDWYKAGNFMNLGEPNVWTAGSILTLSSLIGRVVTALGATIDPV